MVQQDRAVGGVARLLRERRITQRPKMSQEALAKLVGTSQRQVTRWERGTQLPQKHNRKKLGAVLGISEAEFLLAADEFDAGEVGKPAAPAEAGAYDEFATDLRRRHPSIASKLEELRREMDPSDWGGLMAKLPEAIAGQLDVTLDGYLSRYRTANHGP